MCLVDLDLPAGLTSRPLAHTDARAVYEVMAAQERHDTGEVMIEEADIVADWQRPSHDLAASSVGVWSGERLVGYGELMGGDRCDAAVHPEQRGRGIGTALAGWLGRTARSRGLTTIGMPVARGSDADRLLASLGYRVRWESWVLVLPAGARVPERVLPSGYVVRAAESEEWPACWAVEEDAFLEWDERERESFEDWCAGSVRRPGFEPWHLRVVADPGGDVVAMAFLAMATVDLPDGGTGVEGYVDQLAVRADQRGRGLAQALLVDCFGEATRQGAVRSSLSTDSRTGALGLYERVGMVVASTWLNRALDL
ncbi:GNAT family N-acetyltransferase [Nocardioides acrostichi]|uniref:GNAT family N-acetyltransferase n=1 Tax=Nocardioides acrostichi TaxID=2784339 RepID=A0A930YDY8_9ACTN|nr:GNAT family N-acetyltransferase [Nocardioides acrostichi]MBF4162939.1 GNAT family N-acetyltransferase [Nocardioides acrostichi]